MTDILKTISEKYPDLMAYLQGLKRPAKPEWRDYDNAKGNLSKFPLSEIEYESCLQFISKRLNV
jgi:hypothetical protein